MKVQLLGKANI